MAVGLFSRIFDSGAAIKEVTSAVRDGLDALVYTEEEKAADQAAVNAAMQGALVKWFEATKGQNIARRLIALMVVGVWLLQYLVAVVAGSVAIFVDDPARFQALATLLRKSGNDMAGPVMLIMVFYFAGPHVGEAVRAFVQSFMGRMGIGK